MSEPSDPTALPRPFPASAWPKDQAPAVEALWDWHQHVQRAAAASGSDFDFVEEGERTEAGEPLRLLDKEVAGAAYAACAEHGLSRGLLAEQVRSAAAFSGPIRFVTTLELKDFVGRWAGSHVRLLARLAGVTGSWQQPPVDELARAFFLTGRLARLPQDLDRDWLFIPKDDLMDAGVTMTVLRTGTVDEAVRRLLWKQTIRARDAYAQAQPLVKDLEGRWVRQFKRWWLGGLEVLNEIERRGYDVWSRPITLTSVQKARIRLHALIGKAGLK